MPIIETPRNTESSFSLFPLHPTSSERIAFYRSSVDVSPHGQRQRALKIISAVLDLVEEDDLQSHTCEITSRFD